MNQNIINNTSLNRSPTKVIKRYGNRKLYDTERSSYVVLNDIAKMIRNKEEVQIIDNETKDDITSATLTQIIFSSEKKSIVSAPINLLKAIIRRGDGSLSNYLAEIGLFKAPQITDEKINIQEDRNFYGSKEGVGAEQAQEKSLQERVVNAALDPNAVEGEKTILPTSSQQNM